MSATIPMGTITQLCTICFASTLEPISQALNMRLMQHKMMSKQTIATNDLKPNFPVGFAMKVFSAIEIRLGVLLMLGLRASEEPTKVSLVSNSFPKNCWLLVGQRIDYTIKDPQ